MSFRDERFCREWRVYLEDPGLLFEVLVLIRLGVREVVNLDAMFIDLIQNLAEKTGTKQVIITLYYPLCAFCKSVIIKVGSLALCQEVRGRFLDSFI